MTRKKNALIGLLLFCVLIAPDLLFASKRKKGYSEYQLKAVFLEKIADFVDWPESSDFNAKNSPFVITVIGENPFIFTSNNKKSDDWLQFSYKEGKVKIKDKSVEIRYISDISQISGSHLLFISGSMKKQLEEVLEAAKKELMLTVSDTKGFAKRGVHVNFYNIRGSTRLEVNETAIRTSGLSVSSHLLKNAKIVNPLKDRR